MPLTSQQKQEKQLLRAKAAQQRARERALAKSNDPEEQEKRRKKQQEQNQRSIEKARLRQSDPEYQAKQREKARLKQIKRREKKITASPKKKTNNRGLKGRPATAYEKQVMDAIGQLPCIACSLHDRISPIVSLHHVDGRTKPLAHAKVLPLCCYHHDVLLEASLRSQYPDMLPIHAKGKYGGKKQWYDANLPEKNLGLLCYEKVGLTPNSDLFFDI